MTETAHPPRTDDPAARAPLRAWLAVMALTAATFSMITAEMLPVGLLTPMSRDLGVSEGRAGLTVTLTGLVAALAAPAVPLLLGRMDRRSAVVGLVVVLGLANLLSAWSSSLGLLLVGRVLVGVALGGVWALASSVVVRLVPASSLGRALAMVFGGIGIASVLGVPAGTWLGDLADWRLAFGVAGGFALVVALALALLLPALPPQAPVRPRELVRLLGDARMRAGLLFVVLLVTGHFAAYTYVRPLLQTVSGFEPSLISVLLLAYGAAGVVGNFAAGPVAGRAPRGTLLTLGSGIAAATALVVAAGPVQPYAVVVLLLWGLAYGGVSVSSQTWILAAAPDAREPASALFASVFNAAIALGALLGGRVVDAAPLTSVLWLGAALAAAALCTLALTGRTRALRP